VHLIWQSIGSVRMHTILHEYLLLSEPTSIGNILVLKLFVYIKHIKVFCIVVILDFIYIQLIIMINLS